MKVLFYCQHVLGIGHFFRALEILRAFEGDEVVLATGGAPHDVPLPPFVREVRLPALMMDENFKRLHGEGNRTDIDPIREERTKTLLSLLRETGPDLLIVELYPFGRKAFRFEIDPLLAAAQDTGVKIVCSLRDILVEKKDTAGYENRVVDTLNRWFDALLIHADPALVRLDETFSRMADIRVPFTYTGFVTPRPAPGERERMRDRLGIGNGRYIVASAGGGKVGGEVLLAAVRAMGRIADGNVRLRVFTGPFMEAGPRADIESAAQGDGRIAVETFTDEFLSHLAAADLSISMGGYNTTMNLVAARTPALVHPFGRNREQRMRAERLERLGALGVLDNADLEPDRLAKRMEKQMAAGRPSETAVAVDGAEQTVAWLRKWMSGAA